MATSYEINKDSRGEALPENFKLEHLVSIGDANRIFITPEKYLPGLIARAPIKDEKEIVIYIHSEKTFNEVLDCFYGVEILLDWGIMNPELAKKLSGYET